MTLPVSGALSISNINTEFGRGNNLNAYRGTGWYKDDGSSGTFSSGAISMSNFYGTRLTAPVSALSWSGAITETSMSSGNWFATSSPQYVRGWRGYHTGINGDSATSTAWYALMRTQPLVKAAGGNYTWSGTTDVGPYSVTVVDDERSAGPYSYTMLPANKLLVGAYVSAFRGRTQGNVCKFGFNYYLRYTSMATGYWTGGETSTAQTSSYNAYGTASDLGASAVPIGMRMQSGSPYEITDNVNTSPFGMGMVGQTAVG